MPKAKKPLASNEAVLRATGKTWAQWLKILDKLPKEKSHTERAVWLYHKHLKKGWWCQMITVSYERVRGIRDRYQTPTGYQVGVSKTVPISVGALYTWWTTKRTSWLKTKGVTVTSSTKNKYLHMNWPGGTKVDINFWDRGKQKSNVQLQHSKLKTAADAKKMKFWWKKKLEALSVHLET